MQCFVRLQVVRACALFLVVAAGCQDAESNAALACTPGDSHACSCDTGEAGEALCGSDGTFRACVCGRIAALPCSDPGAVFSCDCGDGEDGESICTRSGALSACACAEPLARESAAAADPDSEPAASACPAGFSCVEQMGVKVCAEASGIPPLCGAQSDCVAAGLGRADCIEPPAAGVRVCVLLCQD